MTEDVPAEHERVPGELDGAAVVVVGGVVVVVVVVVVAVSVTVQLVSPILIHELSTVCITTHTVYEPDANPVNSAEADPEPPVLQSTIFPDSEPDESLTHAVYWNARISPFHDTVIEDGPAEHETPAEECAPATRAEPDAKTKTTARAATAQAANRGLVISILLISQEHMSIATLSQELEGRQSTAIAEELGRNPGSPCLANWGMSQDRR